LRFAGSLRKTEKSVLKKYFGKVDLELFATAATDGMRYNVAYYTPS
jgi:hypothetical protein